MMIEKILFKNLKKSKYGFLCFYLFLVSSAYSFPVITNENSFQDVRNVSGYVYDISGDPLIGVTVQIKGTVTGTVTDINGYYSLEVEDDNSILVFSYIGFATQEILIGTQNSINVNLLDSAENLDEVVVVGYGTQKRANLTGAVAVVTSEDLGSQVITSAAESLHGRISGIQMIQGNSQPGKNAPVFQIRGVGTVRSGIDSQNDDSAPLILIDGVQASMNDINPYDIESFSVLKDAASAAIYGVKAANGVVLITTKRGRSGKPRVNFNTYYGWQSATATPDMLNSLEYAEYINESFVNVGRNELFSAEDLANIKSGSNGQVNQTKYFEDGYGKGVPISNIYASVSGGTDIVNYMFSGGVQNQEGILVETDSKRYNFRSNLDVKISPMFAAGFNLAGSYVNTKEPNYAGYGPTQVVRDMIRLAPFAPIFQQDGHIASGSAVLTSPQDKNAINPIARARYGGHNYLNTLNIIPNLFVEFTPIENLVFKLNGSINYTNNDDSYQQKVMTVSDGVTVTTTNGLGTLEKRSINSSNNMFEATGRYNKSIEQSTFAVLGGFAFQKNQFNFLSASNEGYNYDLDQLNAGQGNPSVTGYKNEYARESFFGRFNYDFDDKYLFEANVRIDGSSRFGENNRYGTFPSFSFGWNMANENFMSNVKSVDQLKLRASWGRLGNDAIGDYNQYATINLNQPYVFGNSLAGGAAVTALNNPGIKWETTTTTDIGVDLTMLDYRLNLSADYYRRIGTDVLLSPPIVATLGNVSAPVQNFGEIENKGFESMLSYSSNSQSNFNYRVSLNWTYNDNKVRKLDAEFISANKVITREGDPINSFYGHVITGIFQTNEEAQDADKYGAQPGGTTVAAGDYIWEDTNKDGIVDSKDKVIIGDPNIRNNYGFSIDLSYKNFDFRTLFQGVYGRDVEIGVYGFDARGTNLTTDWLDRWTPTNTDTDIARVAAGYKYNVSLFVGPTISNRIIDASYLRMKNIELGYSLPNQTISRAGFENLRVYMTASNMLTFTKFFKGFDPEDARTFNNVNDSYPLARTFTVGVNATL